MRGTRNGALCACALLMLTFAASGSARPPAAVVRTTPSSSRAVRAYWTPARMRAAKPAEALPPSPFGASQSHVAVAAEARRRSLHQRVTNTGTYPNRTNGKVFFTLPGGPPDGGDYVCSGTAVRSPGKSLVWTAGHCVFDPGALGAGFATNWEFVPAYRAGHRPYGAWPATSLATTPQWQGTGPLSGGDSAFDFGAATVGSRAGRHLEERIGARRLTFNQPRRQIYSAFGYPAAHPPPEFDGQHMFRCRSPFAGSDSSIGPPPAIRISCDMTGGASGGGWVIRKQNAGYVASVTSYGYRDDPGAIYGPYQGGVAHALADSAGG